MSYDQFYNAEPYSSVGIFADLRTGGRRFDPRLDHYSFRGLMIVFFFFFFDNGYVGKQLVAWTKYCAEHWLKELQESMCGCTGRRDTTVILLKMALNTIQSKNHPML